MQGEGCVCHHHHQQFHRSVLCFHLVQCESLLAPFPEKNSFCWIMQQKQQEGEIMKQSDERGNRA